MNSAINGNRIKIPMALSQKAKFAFSSFFAFFTFVISEAFTTYNLLFAIIIFVVVFIFNYINIKKVDFDKLSKIEYINSSKNSSSFGSFDSSTSGGFSGGGGSFGGGGASGRW